MDKKESKKKKKILILCIVVITVVVLTILSIPKKYYLTDGGTVEYKAAIWEYRKVNEMVTDGYRKGSQFKLFGIKLYDSVKFVSYI